MVVYILIYGVYEYVWRVCGIFSIYPPTMLKLLTVIRATCHCFPASPYALLLLCQWVMSQLIFMQSVVWSSTKKDILNKNFLTMPLNHLFQQFWVFLYEWNVIASLLVEKDATTEYLCLSFWFGCVTSASWRPWIQQPKSYEILMFQASAWCNCNNTVLANLVCSIWLLDVWQIFYAEKKTLQDDDAVPLAQGHHVHPWLQFLSLSSLFYLFYLLFQWGASYIHYTFCNSVMEQIV